MTSTQPPDYLQYGNKYFIPTFNTTNYLNTLSGPTTNLDNKYLSKLKNDSSSYTYTLGGVNASNITSNNITVGTNLNVIGNTRIDGDLQVNGTTISVNTENVLIEDNIIMLNSNFTTGTPISTFKSGIEVKRGNETNYQFILNESDQSFKIGALDNLQCVATRQDLPINNGIPYWNSSQSRFDTSSTLFFNGSGTTILSTINISGLATFNNTSILRPSTVLSSLNISGLTALNNTIIQQPTTIGSTLNVSGNANLFSPTTILSSLNISGLATLNNTSILRPSTVLSSLNVSGLATLNNGINISGNTNILSPTTFLSALNIGGILTSSTGSWLRGNVSIRSDLSVAGETILGGSTNLLNPTTILSALNVSGLTNLNNVICSDLYNNNSITYGLKTVVSTLNVSGLTTLNNGLTVSNNTSLFSPTTILSSLNVSGLATFNNQTTFNLNTSNSLIVSGPDDIGNGRLYNCPLFTRGVNAGIGFNYNTGGDGVDYLRSGIQIRSSNTDTTWRTILDTNAWNGRGANIRFYTYDQSLSANSRLGMVNRLEITNNTTATSLTTATVQITGGLAVSDDIICSTLSVLNPATFLSSLNVSGLATFNNTSILRPSTVLSSLNVSGLATLNNTFIQQPTTINSTLSMNDNIILNERLIQLRNDSFHGLRMCGDGTNVSPLRFANISANGPVLHGYAGGLLGSTELGEKALLRWHNSGGVSIMSNLNVSGQSTFNNGLITNSINFGVSNLSNYEEGTFTCSLTNTGGTDYVYNTNNCSYTRIGRIYFITVQFSWRVNPSNQSAPTGNSWECVLGSLPKPTTSRNTFSMGYCQGLPFLNGSGTGIYYQFVVLMDANSNVRLFALNKSTPTNVKYNEFPITASSGQIEMQFSGFYFV
jgi:hypothetical protein